MLKRKKKKENDTKSGLFNNYFPKMREAISERNIFSLLN